jgi:hypothetical protein
MKAVPSEFNNEMFNSVVETLIGVNKQSLYDISCWRKIVCNR